MILTEKKVNKVESNGDFHTITSKVNKNKLAKLYGLLSNIYKNPIGSIVREYASNGYDANVEAFVFGNSTYQEVRNKYSWIEDPDYGLTETEFNTLKNRLKRVSNNEPIIVGIKESQNQIELFIKDFGIGLSPERMENIFFDYLSSTKEDNDDEIGGYGIGAKSALSIYNQFYITTVYNGIEYKYMMGKDEKNIPEGTLLYKGEFDESLENGTIISMHIENSQINQYVIEFEKQLAYLNNVYFEVNDIINNKNILYSLSTLSRTKLLTINKFEIIDFGKFYRRTVVPYNEMHISLGNISYPIDWNELQLPIIYEPFALKFNINELHPTPSRESIIYNEDSRNLILDRIKHVQQYYINKVKTIFTDTNDFAKWISNIYSDYKTYTENKFTVDLTKLLDNSSIISLNLSKSEFIPFKNTTIDFSNLRHYFFIDLDTKINYNSGKIISNYYTPNLNDISNMSFIIKDKINNISYRKISYVLEEVYKKKNDILILNINEDNIEKFTTDKNSITQSEKNKEIFTFYLKQYLEKLAIPYDKYYPTPNWHLKYEAGLSKFGPKKSIKINSTVGWLYYSNCNLNWIRQSFKYDTLEKYKGMIIYDVSENKIKLEKLVMLLKQNKKFKETSRSWQLNNNNDMLKAIVVSKDDYQIMKNLPNAKNTEEAIIEFKIFARILTAIKIKERFEKVLSLNKILWANSLLEENYKKVYHFYFKNYDYGYNDSFVKECLLVAEKYNLFDADILNSLDYLEKYFENLYLLNLINTDFKSDESKLDFINYLNKVKKKRVKEEFLISNLIKND